MKKTFLFFVGLSLIASACMRHARLEETPDFQINYTTVIKDSVFSTHSTPSLDLDKDGAIDFSFSAETIADDGWAYTHYYVEPKNGNEIMLLENIDAEAFNSGATINATTKLNENWSNQKGLLIEVQKMYGAKPVRTGSWSTNSPQKYYLPVRLKKGNKFHYGWIAMQHSVSTEDRFIISATAVHELPDEELKTGK